jgi:membrane fusion protein (multidrug efflux system)
MNEQHLGPRSARAKFVYFLWNNMPRFLLLALCVLIVVLAGAIDRKSASIASSKEAAEKNGKPAVNAVTLALQPTTISDRINLPGNIEPWTTLGLLSKLNGTVEEVLVREGQRVKRGDVIARIDDDDYRIAVERTEAAYNLAKAEFERDRAIYAKGVIPTATLDTNRTRMETTKADFEDAKLQLSRCLVTAPMDGVMQKVDAKVGLQLAVGDPIAEIIDIERVKAVVGIPESDVTAVRGLHAIDFTVQALAGRRLIGKVHYLSSSPETVARIFRLELEVDNRAGDILPGMFLRADIVKKTLPEAIVVPYYSVISRNNEQYVYVEEDGVAKKRNIRLGVMEKWLVEVVEGLKSGDRLIVEGHRDVEDGQPVKVVKAAREMKELTL